MTAPDLAIPGTEGAEPHFFAPWQAKAFALTVALHEASLFTWTEWAEALSARIGAAPLPQRDTPEDHATRYYLDWLAALEDLLAAKGLAEADMIGEMALTWQRAARATPHGTPILYETGRE